MSAVVAILNSQAIAIAADSAVTVNGKIFNRALKIFTLSKYEPIGIMIYGSGTFMMTPWETIIKVYREQLKDSNFDTLEEYKNDFIAFLRSRNFYASGTHQKAFILYNVFFTLFTLIHEEAKKNSSSSVTILDAIDIECDKTEQLLLANTLICDEFSTYTITDFDAFLGVTFDDGIQSFFTDNGIILPQETIAKLKSISLLLIQKHENFTNPTGLVFVGFGNAEIFPGLISMNVHFAIEHRFKQYENIEQRRQISHENGSAISPFAQTEAMNTILTGIAPNLQNTLTENFRQYLHKYNNLLISIVGATSPIGQQIATIDVNYQVDSLVNEMEKAKNLSYIKPLVDAVSSLSKEDLAEMAESLIYLTYLQKRITFAAEDVGGDVDVAVISKGDGFIWIKRKHYFKPELNQHFFGNYLK